MQHRQRNKRSDKLFWVQNNSESSYYGFESRQMVFCLYVDCKIPNLILQIKCSKITILQNGIMRYNTTSDVTDILMGASKGKLRQEAGLEPIQHRT